MRPWTYLVSLLFIAVIASALPAEELVAIPPTGYQRPTPSRSKLPSLSRHSFGYLVARYPGGEADLFNFRTGKSERIDKSRISIIEATEPKRIFDYVGPHRFVASRIEEALGRVRPAIVADVIKSGDNVSVFVTHGIHDGIKVGQRLLVQREAGPITDPLTQRKLGTRSDDICEVQVVEVQEQLCRCEIPGDESRGVKKGDTARRKDEDVRIAVLVHPVLKMNEAITIEMVADNGAASKLTAILVDRGVRVVERSSLRKVFGELELQKDDVFLDADVARRAGKLLGASSVLIGILPVEEVHYRGRTFRTDVRLVNVETGLIEMAVVAGDD